MTFAGQIETALALGFKEQLQLLPAGPEFEHQGARTGLNDFIESASGELMIEFNRNGLKEYTIHLLSLEHVAMELQAVSLFLSCAIGGFRFFRITWASVILMLIWKAGEEPRQIFNGMSPYNSDLFFLT